MARKERSGKILFEPRRYRMDPAVLAMSAAARGAYSMLFCAACDTHEPGVIEPATDEVLAGLAMMPVSRLQPEHVVRLQPEHVCWLDVRDEVARAFDTSTPGRWVQRGLVETFKKQDEFIDAQRERGRLSARKRSVPRKLNQASTGRAKPVDVPLQPEAPSSVATPSVLGSRFSVQEEKAFGPALGVGPGTASPMPPPAPAGAPPPGGAGPFSQSAHGPPRAHSATVPRPTPGNGPLSDAVSRELAAARERSEHRATASARRPA